MGIESTLYEIDPRSSLFRSIQSDAEVADFVAFLRRFYESEPPGSPPSWWYSQGREPILSEFANLVTEMLVDAPGLSTSYLELHKDGFFFDRHFGRLARSTAEAELVSTALHGATPVGPFDTDSPLDGSVRFTTTARCSEVTAWLVSPSVSTERLLAAAKEENDPDPDYPSWAVRKLSWAREQLEKLHRDAAHAGNIVLGVWA